MTFLISVSKHDPTLVYFTKYTSRLLPGSFTVASCASLYFLNAGSREGIRSELEVNALISGVNKPLELCPDQPLYTYADSPATTSLS